MTDPELDREAPAVGVPPEGTEPTTDPRLDREPPAVGVPPEGTGPTTDPDLDRESRAVGVPREGTKPTPDPGLDREPRAVGMPPEGTEPTTQRQPLATYEDLRYRDVFWAGRAYEDLSDRVAIRALLPDGRALLEVGAGFGRLVDEYERFERVVLLDASAVHVEAARELYAADPRVEVVAGDALALPFGASSFDVVVCVRVAHHFEDLRPLLVEIARVLRPGGSLVLEFANKRNVKAIVRHALRRRTASPFGPGPARYRPFHYDHAPSDVRAWLSSTGFTIVATRAASLFRVPIFSRRVPPRLLVRVESPLQALLAPITPGPSVFYLARRNR